MKRVLLVVSIIALGSLLAHLSASAQPASIPSESIPANAQDIIKSTPETTLAADKPPANQPIEQASEIADGGELKKRDLGEAFKIFKPSEAISADNAVPFPIDI